MFTRPKIWVRVLFGILALTLIAAGGMFLFRMGFSQGAITAGGEALSFSEMPMADGYTHPYAYGYPMRFHFFPFGGLLFGFLFLMMIGGLMRRAFWGRRWAMAGGPVGRHGFGFGRMEDMHAELHKRMDQAESQPDAPTEEA